MEPDTLRQNIDEVMRRIHAAAARAGSSVSLVAATKTVPAETINLAIEYGITAIGENRVQEYLQKKDAVKGGEWHFIGTLQRNKAKYLVGSVSLIQSVSSAPLADEIDRLAAQRGVIQPVLAELNACDEASKTGASSGEIDALIDHIRSLSHVKLRGLMAVPAAGAPADVYDGIRKVFDRHAGGDFDILSVGMSGDYELAIEHGSNMVRIGSSIFGARNYIGR